MAVLSQAIQSLSGLPIAVTVTGFCQVSPSEERLASTRNCAPMANEEMIQTLCAASKATAPRAVFTPLERAPASERAL